MKFIYRVLIIKKIEKMKYLNVPIENLYFKTFKNVHVISRFQCRKAQCSEWP